jgi:DNA-binding MarR family transcriptional regulator
MIGRVPGPAARDGPHHRAGQLAELLSLTTGATTGVVDRLEAAGFALRESDPADRRRVIIRPLPERMAEVDTCRLRRAQPHILWTIALRGGASKVSVDDHSVAIMASQHTAQEAEEHGPVIHLDGWSICSDVKFVSGSAQV